MDLMEILWIWLFQLDSVKFQIKKLLIQRDETSFLFPVLNFIQITLYRVFPLLVFSFLGLTIISYNNVPLEYPSGYLDIRFS
ncbi:hypothetical protein D0X99_16805 [Algoriphagus lacus]|uniref:Uncharacterized protein n=1 Tax=Algoriphagus lacus TaxID=2056311 RepID=A0A418PNV5_9BACT|nr:hypothetical protein D0X99_16805 [Algoriphagus lacus]